jgi:hypothetical protein
MKRHQRVLVAELAPFMRKAFVKALLRQGCRPVTTDELFEKDDALWFTTKRGPRQAHDRIDIALVDCMTDNAVTGAMAVRELTARGITCIGIASLPEFNQPLKEAGAKLVVCKAAALGAIFSGVLSMNRIKEAPQDMLDRVAQFAQSFRDNMQLKNRLNALIQNCM